MLPLVFLCLWLWTFVSLCMFFLIPDRWCWNSFFFFFFFQKVLFRRRSEFNFILLCNFYVKVVNFLEAYIYLPLDILYIMHRKESGKSVNSGFIGICFCHLWNSQVFTSNPSTTINKNKPCMANDDNCATFPCHIWENLLLSHLLWSFFFFLSCSFSPTLLRP